MCNQNWSSHIQQLVEKNATWPNSVNYFWLVVWNMISFFPYIGNVIIPTDELIFFRWVGQPPTTPVVWLPLLPLGCTRWEHRCSFKSLATVGKVAAHTAIWLLMIIAISKSTIHIESYYIHHIRSSVFFLRYYLVQEAIPPMMTVSQERRLKLDLLLWGSQQDSTRRGNKPALQNRSWTVSPKIRGKYQQESGSYNHV